MPWKVAIFRIQNAIKQRLWRQLLETWYIYSLGAFLVGTYIPFFFFENFDFF